MKKIQLIGWFVILSGLLGNGCALVSPKSPSRSISSDLRNCQDHESADGYWHFDHKNENPVSDSDYCSRTARSMIRRFCFKSGKLGYSNNGGLLGLPTGVCWWHSQFHKKAVYLSYFDPTDTREISSEEFKTILQKIHRHEVVKIRGYSSLLDFISDENHPERKKILKKFLQKQMAIGTLGKAEWVHGLEGRANQTGKKPWKAEPQREKQKQEIEQVYSMVRNSDPNKIQSAYVMLQSAGFVAHALLIHDAEILQRGPFQDTVIYAQDSNYQEDGPRGREAYYFDEESAQWFSETSYQQLQRYRAAHETFIIVRERTPMTPEQLRYQNRVVSKEWTIQVQRDQDNFKINEGFKNFCKKDLFIPVER